MPVQSPYEIIYATTAGGSVAAADLGGLSLAAVAILSGGTAQLTLLASASPGAATLGTASVTHPAIGVGTAVRVGVTGTFAPVLLSPPVGPLYGVQAVAVGTNLTAGTVAFYVRG